MAYMNQAKKAIIATELKLVVPPVWKYTLSVLNNSTIVMTIKSAPMDLCALIENRDSVSEVSHATLNIRRIERAYSGYVLSVMRLIVSALNIDNHDHSDWHTDYFDVGHYVTLNIGTLDKPFVIK